MVRHFIYFCHYYDMAYRRSYKRRRYGGYRRRYGGYRRRTLAGSFGSILGRMAATANRQAWWDRNSTIYNTRAPAGQRWDPATRAMVPTTLGDRASRWVATGRGSYGLGKLGRLGGRAIGGLLGSRKAGAAVGGFLGNAASTYLGGGGYTAAGFGDYDLEQSGPTNSLISGSNVSVPTMAGGDEIGSVTISHKEYLGNVTGSVAFENSVFALNPGLSTTFPWLSQIAQNYEEYSMNQLMFTYTSLLSDSTAAGVIGSINMTTNYNAGQLPFTNTSDMLNNIGTVSARPIDGPIIHGIECDDAKNVMSSYFVRSGAVPNDQDIKTYDMGTFQLSTEGMPQNDQLQGQLWVSYNITLRKPKIFTAAGKGIGCDMYKMLTNNGVGTPSNNRNFMVGKVMLRSPVNNLGTIITCPVPMSFQVNFPQTTVLGYYKITARFRNPTDDSGFPNQPKLWPYLIFSNAATCSPQMLAHYTVDSQFVGDNCLFQTGYYDNGAGLNFDPCITFEHCFQLLGSFAIPTFIRYEFGQYGSQSFQSTDCEIRIEQINPLFIAPTGDNPATWVPYTVTQ